MLCRVLPFDMRVSCLPGCRLQPFPWRAVCRCLEARPCRARHEPQGTTQNVRLEVSSLSAARQFLLITLIFTRSFALSASTASSNVLPSMTACRNSYLPWRSLLQLTRVMWAVPLKFGTPCFAFLKSIRLCPRQSIRAGTESKFISLTDTRRFP